MHSKWKDLLLAVMLVAVLALPAGLVGAEDKEGSTDTEDAFSGSVESDSELLTVERVDASEVAFDIGEIDMIDVSDTPFDWTTENAKKDLVSIGSGPELQGIEMSQQPLRGITDRTRASDDERNQDYYDYANASVINSNGETLQGSLTWSSIAANQDMIDWYKIGLSNVATTAGASPVKNITMNLKSFTATSGSMYELRIDDTDPQALDLYDDYGDVLDIYAIYTDDMFGDGDIGGWRWFYDDLDDNDGWTWDENWTLSFNSPRHSWGGPDNDGFANRLTEVGWIYIGVSLNFYMKSDAPQNRPTFTSSYEIEVDTSRDVTVLNAGNHWKNATAFTPLGVKKTGIQMWSDRDNMDWWKFEGTDSTKLWNVSMQVNRTSNVWAGQPTQTQFWDNWLEIAIVWRTDGADDQWGTADDRYTGVIFTMSYIFSGGGFIDDTLSVWLHNNWTEAPDRTVWLGLQETPIHGAHQSGQVLGFYLPDHTIWSTYDLTVSIGEVKPNVPPEITEVTLESDFVQDPSGGYYDSEFLLTVTYQDEDDDPPEEIWVYIDKDTAYEKAQDISGSPTDVFDHDYTDGRKYKLEMLGEDLTDDPFPHTVHVRAVDDIPSISIRDPAWSELFNFEAGIPVWDDEPVTTNLNWQPFEELQEDDPTTYFPLESIDGMFKDPENKFEAFYVWNLTSEEWADSYDTSIAFIEVVENDGIWQAAVTPKHNENGKVNVKFQAEDLHSWVNLSTSITIRAVNDPPTVKAIEIDGTPYEVDNVDPTRPLIHLEDEVTIKEDEEFSFTIIAEDTDKEDERTPLEYSYVRSTSSDWDEDPDVGYNTGEVTFTPTNNDVRAGNDKMVFTIDDHGEDGDIKLEVYVDITNTNDPPTIMIPTTTPRSWKQFSKISIRPIASDEDKGDQITFSVNFVDAIGEDYDSIEDQLPYLEATKGIDWDITPTTGDFWFSLDDQNIWKTSTGMVKSQEIVIVFMVSDNAVPPGTATQSITLVLNDENEEPEKPTTIHYQPSSPKEKEPVNFYVDPVSDPDEDKLTYKWDFGDGSTGEGINVNHTYTTKGYKVIQMWVEDGQYATEKINTRIEVAEAIVADDDDDIQPPDDDVAQTDDNTMLYIIVAVIIVVIIIVILLFLFLLLRKKPQPAQQMYPGYDQQALAAYGQQGLPPGYAGELPPQQTPELPPAGEGQMPPDNLPPAGGEMSAQPELAPSAPEAESQASPEQPSGNACPNCGSPVDPTWFLCPNCKSPLQ